MKCKCGRPATMRIQVGGKEIWVCLECWRKWVSEE